MAYAAAAVAAAEAAVAVVAAITADIMFCIWLISVHEVHCSSRAATWS
jgi:hypothetical protein